ncbi:MAG: hypothetical protein PVJ43_07080 [Gemmatimonadales bacterium]|jgi:hypothetical protein
MPHDMTIADALSQVKSIRVDDLAPPVLHTAAAELAQACGGTVVVGGVGEPTRPEPGVFRLLTSLDGVNEAADANSVFVRLRRDGSGFLAARPARNLFPFVTHLLRDLADDGIASVEEGKVFRPAFEWLRSTYDYFLNQEGRIQRGLDRASYVRRLAESGFTHLEVNGLAFPAGLESGPPGEAYPMFYTYCPALDQFVSTELNDGLYPADYLSANLEYLKRNADLAREYGMVPGLLCFEPRSVPEEFFRRYPMLRGARVDHPFRSFKPRYNMTIAHPLVREHYAEMVRKLMKEVPELGFLSIWTNDSGAGFEHTQSLYVGRNGGAYLIREWKNERDIAEAAGNNALRFFEVLRDAGRETNPDFRVLTRLESFYGEHDVIWNGLGDGLEVETASLVAKGWEMPYAHPRYPDSKTFVAGTIHQLSFAQDERRLATELEERSSRAHFYMAAGPNSLFAPLVGVPYPSLTFERLKLLHENGVTHLAHVNGTAPPELAPFNVNHEIFRCFQFDPRMESAATMERLARGWAGEGLGDALRRAWGLAEEAILAFPHVSPLYSTFGSVWYRLWARPLVPNIEAIPARERGYYQDHMCTTPHNPNNVDLSRDVLFQLTTVDECRNALERIDANVWEPLDAALELLDSARAEAVDKLGAGNVIEDQWVRLSALRCWLMTQRSVAAWVVGVCGTMQAVSESERSECRAVLDEMIARELSNSKQLLELLDSGVEFMATTDLGESALMYGRNLKELVEKRIELMTAHRDDEPYIDPKYIEKNAGQLA